MAEPINYDVVLVTLGDDGDSRATNVPWSVIDHSPTGFDWGYSGSGPADLALNILNAFCPPGHDGQEPVQCYQGTCSRTAQLLHQQFKFEYLAGLPPEGGTITADTIRQFLADNQPTFQQPEQGALII